MHTLITRFGNKRTLAAELGITRESVAMAFIRGRVPTTWLPKLKLLGLSHAELTVLPLTAEGRAILTAFAPHS